MDQEDIEKISFDCLRNMVDEAIKTKNICIIEKPELKENQLRYMQKYTELHISKDGLAIGNGAIVLAFLAIGISYWLTNISDQQKLIYQYIGGSFVLISIVLIYYYQYYIKPKNEFVHEIILKIEERLTC